METIATQWQNECERGFQRRTCVASWTDSTSTRSSSLLKVATLLTFHGDDGDGDEDDGDGLPAYSHHDKIPPWWGNVSNDKGGNVSVSNSHHS